MVRDAKQALDEVLSFLDCCVSVVLPIPSNTRLVCCCKYTCDDQVHLLVEPSTGGGEVAEQLRRRQALEMLVKKAVGRIESVPRSIYY